MSSESGTEKGSRVFPYNFTDDEQFSALVGSIAASWAGIEFQLSHLFTWLMGCSPLHGAAAYFKLQNTKSRIDMMEGLTQLLFDEEEKKTVKAILGKCRKSASVRNHWLHAPYLKEGGKVYQLAKIGKRYPHGFKKLVDQKRAWEEAAEIATVSIELGHVITELTKRRPLMLRRETVPEALQQKFKELFGIEMVSGDTCQTDDDG